MNLAIKIVTLCTVLAWHECQGSLDSCKTLAETEVKSTRDEFRARISEIMGAVERENEGIQRDQGLRVIAERDRPTVTTEGVTEGTREIATVDPKVLCRAFGSYMCCMKKVATSCQDADDEVMMKTNRMTAMMLAMMNQAERVCDMPKTEALETVASDCECTYSSGSSCVHSIRRTIRNHQKTFDQSLMNLIASDTPNRTQICLALTSMACCLKKIIAECDTSRLIVKQLLRRDMRDVREALETETEADTICEINIQNPFHGIDAETCTCPSTPLAGDTAVTCSTAFTLMNNFEQCTGGSPQLAALISEEAPTEEKVKQALNLYCKTTVPGVIACMVEDKFASCSQTVKDKVTAYAANYRSRLCDGDKPLAQYTLLAGDILAALTTTKERCKISGKVVKRCMASVTSINRRLQKLIASKNFDKMVPVMEKMTKAGLTCVRNALMKRCGQSVTQGILTLLRSFVFFGVDISTVSVSGDQPSVDTKSLKRLSLKIYGTGHSKTSDQIWKACSYPVGWHVLFSNRYITIEAYTEPVDDDGDEDGVTMISKIRVTFKQSNDVTLTIDASEFSDTVTTWTTEGIEGLENVKFTSVANGAMVRITQEDSSLAIYLGVWKTWFSMVLVRGSKNLIDKDTSGLMKYGCLAGIKIPDIASTRQKRATKTECSDACSTQGEIMNQCAYDCTALNDTTVADSGSMLTSADTDAEAQDVKMRKKNEGAVGVLSLVTLLISMLFIMLIHNQ